MPPVRLIMISSTPVYMWVTVSLSPPAPGAAGKDAIRARKRKRRGFPRRFQFPLSAKDQNRRSTAWSACAESDRAVVDSC